MNWHQVLIIIKDNGWIFKVVALQHSLAHLGCLCKPCTNSIHDCLHLQLPSECLIVDDDSWPKLGAISVIILNFLVKVITCGAWNLKCGVVKHI